MLKKFSVSCIKFYQRYVRYVFPSSCQFSPSCSEYIKQAILKYGFLKGGFRGAKRLLSCHPLSGKSGYDPVI